MDHKGDVHDHKALYIHGILSAREDKALTELGKISEAKTFDFARWEPGKTTEEKQALYDEYLLSCTCSSDFHTIKQALIIKEYEKVRPLIVHHAEHLPECVALLAIYDELHVY